jgi:alkylhydroperoxidase family enzyme
MCIRHHEEALMARIPLDSPRPPLVRIGEWYSRRRFGAVLEPARAMAHNPRVLRTYVREEMSAEKWNRAPQSLKLLVEMTAAATVGCEWCLDFGYWLSIDQGVDAAKVRDIARWRDSDAYTDVERLAIEYAEAMSQTPSRVTDELVAALRKHLDDGQLVELTMMVAVENQRARFNSALGLTSQGFSDRCELAPRT